MDAPDLKSLSLKKIALPSISVTMDTKYQYAVYIAIDEDDYLVNAQRFCFVKVIVVKGGTFTDAINEIAEVAYDDNMTYFVRINDDTRFITQNWTSVGIKTLLEFKPQNVGVVGPTCEEGNKKILTHDMVHMTHLDIFGYYYSPVFENFWADDWITEIYKPNRSRKRLDWTVRHQSIHGTRYEFNQDIFKYFENMQKQDKLFIEQYLNFHSMT